MADPRTPTRPQQPAFPVDDAVSQVDRPPRLPTLPHILTSPTFSPLLTDLHALARPPAPASPGATPKAAAHNASARLLSPMLSSGSALHAMSASPSPASKQERRRGQLLSPLIPRTPSQSRIPRSASTKEPTPSPRTGTSLSPIAYERGRQQRGETPPSTRLALLQRRISSPIHLTQPISSSSPSHPQPIRPSASPSPLPLKPCKTPTRPQPPTLSSAQIRAVLDELERADDQVSLRCARVKEEIGDVRKRLRGVERVVGLPTR